jgi:membrane-associated phospholipid phosphatase
MKSRVGFLFCILLVTAYARGTEPATPAHALGAHPALEYYRTQPGTAELPPRYRPPAGADARARLAYWNEVALRAVAVDHTPSTAGAVAPEQLGPTRTSRALAIVHIAIHDALNAVWRRAPGYSGPLPALADSSPDAAIAQAAHDTLVALYPRQAQRLDAWLAEDLARLPAGRGKYSGIDLGRRAAAAILALRADDGMYQGEPVVGQDYPAGTAPGQWRPDPDGWSTIAMGAHWYHIRPFVLSSAAQFRAPPPPDMRSMTYERAFEEVKTMGGDGVRTATRRTPDQTVMAIYWSYDGTAWIGTPPRMYNQITVQLALARPGSALDLARVLALVNVAIADATIAVWETKFHYDFWRPVTAVRAASPGSSPDGHGDGNRATHADPGWTPLGSPASNLIGPNFTPPFPAYPSGHAGLGGALFQMLRRLYGDAVRFSFVSDEFNGITRDNQGRVRPYLPRSFRSLSQAEEENGQSRIYQGVHWQFDKTAGADIGHKVADYVFLRGLVRPEN